MTLAELLNQAGWPMVPLYVCSLLAVAVFTHKLLALQGLRLGDLGWLDAVVDATREGRLDEARLRCNRTPHPAGRVLEAVLRVLEHRPDRAEAEARRVGSLQLQQAERHLALLAFIAQAAPLLGLLGTVIGMVELFVSLQGASAGAIDVALLSSGIWKALLTTAAGLIVALPTLGGHAWLSARCDLLRLQMGDAVQQVLTALPAPSQRGRTLALVHGGDDGV